MSIYPVASCATVFVHPDHVVLVKLQSSQSLPLASLMLSLLLRGIRQMNAKQSLMAALVGIGTMIAMPLVATAGDRYAGNYENSRWQAPGAVMPVGHHHGWRNSAQYNPGLICDEDGDDCHPAIQCDEDGDDCHYATWPDGDDDDCGASAGYG